MTKIYSRDNKGRFSFSPRSIKNGSLYCWSKNKVVVRARKMLNNGMVLVSIHDRLFGQLLPEELEIIGKDKVAEYLAEN